MIFLAYPWAVLKLDANLGMAKTKNVSISQALFNSNFNLNWLSAARLFLFVLRVKCLCPFTCAVHRAPKSGMSEDV